ncbi:nucleic acid binding OB-fold tRNA/helicase-type [Halorubrum californiense DSM 19288]|uniref:Nucleic acid binding OB-fold tRNA/helicase-type n=1 Tax=Halorubrum californiense DSM 19288 TaxID=1227465 RepID=M0DUL7_9EURY|nr:nucleic acid binding OB-fold tRNA/helicase-type [Halorubrum californiense DSM 19288]
MAEQGLEPAETEPAVEPLRPNVDLQTQAKVDANHPDAGMSGLSLAAEEKALAREAEKARTRERWDRRQSSDREARTRQVIAAGSHQRRDEFAERRASVDPWADPEQEDPRATLAQDELAAVNQEARRIAANTKGWTDAAVSRQLAARVANGDELVTAVIQVTEQIQEAPGTIIPIEAVSEVARGTVSIAGEWAEDWEPAHPAIQQVGLLEDDTGRIKVTVWRKSGQPRIDEGERVRLVDAATSWYDGRVSVALTGWSRVDFPERDRWWEG